MKNKVILRKCIFIAIGIVAAYIEMYTIWEYYFKDNTYSKENIFSACLFLGLIYLYYQFIKCCIKLKNNKALVCGGITGILFGVAMVFGNKVYYGYLQDIFVSTRSIAKYGMLLCGQMIFWSQLFTLGFNILLTYQLTDSKYIQLREKKKYRLIWMIIWLSMFLCYMPCYFSNFPGIMSYDSGKITRQALGILPFDNFHPFLHTMIWTGCVKLEQLLGVPQFGLVLYSIGQALIVTAVFTYIVRFMTKRGVNRFFVTATWLFYSFCPTIVLFSLITTKDILFGTSVAGVVMILYQIWELRETEQTEDIRKRKQLFIILTIVGSLSCLLRNNMIYAMILAGVFAVFSCKPLRRMLVVSFMAIAISYYLITGLLYYTILGIGTGDVREMMPVPAVQIARVYTTEGDKLSSEEKSLILKWVSSADKYEELFADPVKDSFNSKEYEENKSEFWTLWGKLFVQYPMTYVEAFMTLNVPYWYPEADSARTYIELGNYSSYYTFEYKDWLPNINRFYNKIAANTNYENASGIMRWPLMRQFFSLSLPFWMFIILIVTLAARNKKEWIVPFFPVMFLWMTYLLGPVSNFRYIYPMVILYPVMLLLILGGGMNGKKLESTYAG